MSFNKTFSFLTIIVFIFSALFVASVSSASQTLSGELVIPGTGDSQDLLREIARQFEKKYPGTRIIIPGSIGSSGGIKHVGTGKAKLGRIARVLRERDKKYGLTVLPFAECPVLVVGNLKYDLPDNLTYDQLIGIYSGTITDWSQLGGRPGKIYPVGREIGDSSRNILDAGIPGFKSTKNKAAIIRYTTPEAIDSILKNENTIGYAPAAMITRTGLRIFKLNGIFPSPENLQKGFYPFTAPFSLIHKGEPGHISKAFIDFLFSPEGKEIIKSFGCLPLN